MSDDLYCSTLACHHPTAPHAAWMQGSTSPQSPSKPALTSAKSNANALGWSRQLCNSSSCLQGQIYSPLCNALAFCFPEGLASQFAKRARCWGRTLGASLVAMPSGDASHVRSGTQEPHLSVPPMPWQRAGQWPSPCLLSGCNKRGGLLPVA